MRVCVLAVAVSLTWASAAAAQSFSISSPAFAPGGAIPSKYTCDAGLDSPNPALVFSGAPATTRSLVLIMDDPDVPKTLVPSGEFTHWMVWDLAPDATGIAEGEGKGGISGIGRPGYMGPCPTDREHRYFFKLLALDTTIAGPIKTRTELNKAIEGHVLQQTQVMGTYARVKK